MTFLWRNMLWLLLLVPVLVAVYLYILKRRKAFALRYANLALIRKAMQGGAGFRRHVPAILTLLALIAMIVSMARPALYITLPSQRGTIVLALDISGSMAQSMCRDPGPWQASQPTPWNSGERKAVRFIPTTTS